MAGGSAQHVSGARGRIPAPSHDLIRPDEREVSLIKVGGIACCNMRDGKRQAQRLGCGFEWRGVCQRGAEP